MTAEYLFSVTGQTSSSFSITFSSQSLANRPNSTYFVTVQLVDPSSSIEGIAIANRSTTGFDVQLTAAPQSSDVFQFHVFESTTPAGRLLNVQTFTQASAGTLSTTYTPTTGTNSVWLRMVAQGGGGGGAGGGATGAAAGAGGASGFYLERLILGTAAITGGSVSATTNSNGGGAGANGSTGGDVSVVINSTTYTCKGGLGGTGMANRTSTFFSAGGGINATGQTTSGVDFISQNPGTAGVFLAGSFAISGIGGNCPLGSAGAARDTGGPGAGNAGQGYGAGGSGAAAATSGVAGAAGGSGIILIHEYS